MERFETVKATIVNTKRKVQESAKDFAEISRLTMQISTCEEVIRNSPFLQPLNIKVVHVPDQYRDLSSTRARECLGRLVELRDELHMLLPPELWDIPWNLMKS